MHKAWWLLAIPMFPLLVGVAHNEWAASESLQEMSSASLPSKTTSLKVRAAMLPTGSDGTQCRLLAAHMIATQQTHQALLGFFSERSRTEARAYTVSWPSGTRAAGYEVNAGELGATISEVPPVVEKLLIQHAFLPKGVGRAVVFTTKDLPSRLDPRCW